MTIQPQNVNAMKRIAMQTANLRKLGSANVSVISNTYKNYIRMHTHNVHSIHTYVYVYVYIRMCSISISYVVTYIPVRVDYYT